MLEVDMTRPGIWTELFPKALDLMAHLEKVTNNPVWSFGGGTVLMLRINHRLSKDIDLFVPDPQYLGFVNPRLSDAAEDISSEYEESAEFIKLNLPAGEIDVVVCTPLTHDPYEIVQHAGRKIRVETNAEIIAKKFWHRGDRPKARDLFDLCAVAKADPGAISAVLPFMEKHGATFLSLMDERANTLRKQFESIDTLAFRDTFEQCAELAHSILGAALAPDEPARAARADGRLYIGSIVELGEGEAVQRIGRNTHMTHRLAHLTAPVAIDEQVEIRYQSGVGIVQGRGQEREYGLSR